MDQQKEMHLLPISGDGPRLHAVFTPLEESAPVPHRVLHHLSALLSALSCLICITVVFLIALSAAARLDPTRAMLDLAQSSFLGLGVLDIRIPSPNPLPAPESLAPPQANPEESISPSTMPNATPDIAEGTYPVLPSDLSCGGNLSALYNETNYQPDMSTLASAPLPFPDLATHQKQFGAGAPYVLILHTHGTEAYLPEEATVYTDADRFRSEDITENVVAVGTVMAQAFQQSGIPVIHHTEMLDQAAYSEAYDRSLETIRTYIQQYPSIQIILDVHRDSVVRTDGTRIQPVTTIDGVEYAQFMPVVGTDYRGADHPDWQNNLNFALKLQTEMMELSPNLVRAVNLRGAAFHAQYRPGSLLLEIGSCGNTLSQVKRTGVLTALSIAEVVGVKTALTVDDILHEGSKRLTLPAYSVIH